MRKIDRLLPQALANDEVMRAARAMAVFKRWPEVVGEALAERSWPDRYTRGTVWVAVRGSAWAQELRLMKPLILERLNALAGDPTLFVNARFGERALPPREAAPTPEPVVEREPELHELSIREIMERRLAKRRTDTRD